jgi:hypothetical protein
VVRAYDKPDRPGREAARQQAPADLLEVQKHRPTTVSH